LERVGVRITIKNYFIFLNGIINNFFRFGSPPTRFYKPCRNPNLTINQLFRFYWVLCEKLKQLKLIQPAESNLHINKQLRKLSFSVLNEP